MKPAGDAPIDLADFMLQLFNPALHARMQMDALQRAHPQKIKSDSKTGFSGVEERVMSKSPGLVDALIDRNAEITSDPLTADQLNQMILDMFEGRARGMQQKQRGIL